MRSDPFLFCLLRRDDNEGPPNRQGKTMCNLYGVPLWALLLNVEASCGEGGGPTEGRTYRGLQSTTSAQRGVASLQEPHGTPRS